MLAIFLAMMLCAVLLGLTLGRSFQMFMVFGAAAAAACYLILPRLSKWLSRLGPLRAAILLALLCLLVKGLWVAFVHPGPQSDAYTYWKTARTVSLGTPFAPYRVLYTSLFPHIFGYSAFLGQIFRIFGTRPIVGLWVNVALSVCAGLLMFQLCRRWISLEAGISAFLIWIVLPNQTVYNSIILADLFYSTLFLAFLLAVTWVHRLVSAPADASELLPRVSPLRIGLSAAAGAALLRLINASRPIAAIPVIALLLWVLLLRGKQLSDRRAWRVWLPFLVLTVGLYAATGPLWDAVFTRCVGGEPSGMPGYNIYVGFNQESGGLHNQADSALLFEYAKSPGATPKWAQERMLEEAKTRITSGGINFPKLMLRKLRTFLSSDCPAGYVSGALPSIHRLSMVCYVGYDALLLLALLGGVGLWRRREHSPALLLPLYALGLTMAQMLVEVAMRYHYSLLPVFILIGQFALFGVPWRRGDREGADAGEKRAANMKPQIRGDNI